MNRIIVAIGLIWSSLVADVNVGDVLSKVQMDGNTVSYLDGKAWDSSMLNGKVSMIMYVDPDEKSKGTAFKPEIEALEKELDFDKFQIVVILNLKATWKPNAVLKKFLKEKAEDYPKRIYVLDKESVLVKSWKAIDNEYNVLVTDKKAKVIYSHSGKWKNGEISKIDTIIRKSVH